MAAQEGVTKEELVASLSYLENEQAITLVEDDDLENSHAASAKNITIFYGENSGDHHQPSHYVTTKTCTDYKWEKIYYHGHMCAVHVQGKVYAHVLSTHTSSKVRITAEESGTDGRVLLKDFEGVVVDIDWAKVPDEFILACMEQNGACWVYAANVGKPVTATLLVQIRMSDVSLPADICSRAIFCTHVPEDGSQPVFKNRGDPSNQLIMTCGGKAVVVSIPIIQTVVDSNKKVVLDKNPNYLGVITMTQGTQIWDAKMSPDGIVLCLAREDGMVHFYQCDMRNNEQDASMVYTWKPHDGKPVHTVSFFDDLTATSQQEQFWMFALSGSEFGHQFRLWNCQHWYCMQTINIQPSPDRPMNLPSLQALVDPKGGYLILTDTTQNIMLFLRVDRNVVERFALVRSVNEFLVGSPVLSFAVNDVSAIRPARGETGFRAKLLTIHSNTLQHMDVAFVGEHVAPARNTLASTSVASMKYESGDAPKKSDSQVSLTKMNGDGKKPTRQRGKKSDKKAKKIREQSSSNETSESADLPVSESKENILKKELEAKFELRDEAQSPVFVLQPPSAFDSVVSVRRSSSQMLAAANSPMMEAKTVSKEMLVDSGEEAFLTPSSREMKREEHSVGSNLDQGFGMPPVENVAHVNGKVSGESRSNSYQNLASTQKEHWTNQQDYAESRMTGGRGEDFGAGLVDRISGLENTLRAVSTVIDHQSQILQTLIQSVEQLKSTPPPPSTDKSVAKSIDALFQNFTSLQGLEGRLTSSIGSMSKNVQDNVSKELKFQLGPGIQKSLKPIGDKLAQDVQAQLNNVDANLKIKLDEALRSKQFATAISQNLAAPFAESAKKAAQEVLGGPVIQNTVQQALTGTFSSVNKVFLDGTKEYVAQMNRSLDGHLTKIDESLAERVRKMETVTAQACTTAIQAASVELMDSARQTLHQNMEHLYTQIMTNLGSQLSKKLNALVIEEMREQQNVMHESLVQAVNMRSGMVTPGGASLNTQYKLQQAMSEIKAALAKSDYSAAFRIALSASDLGAVMFVCEKVPVKEVFGATEVLQMPVLFSLIQQLAVDIGSKTELKLQYLQEALLGIQSENLDASSLKFLRTVLSDVTKALNKFLVANPGHASSRTIRMMAHNANLQLTQVSAMHSGKD